MQSITPSRRTRTSLLLIFASLALAAVQNSDEAAKYGQSDRAAMQALLARTAVMGEAATRDPMLSVWLAGRRKAF